MKRMVILCAMALLLPRIGYTQNDSIGHVITSDTLAPVPVATSGRVLSHTSNEHRYHFRYAADVPICAVGIIWCGYAFSKIYDKPASSLADIHNLDKNNIPAFDRWAAGMHDANAANMSDYFFYGSMPLPLLLLADKKIRKDAPAVGFLYLEAMSITGLLYTSSTYFVDRYRPETYNTDKPDSEKLDGNYRNAFFAGHVALVGTATFFAATIYADYHPHDPFRWVLYGGAIAATGTTAYLRHIAGKHFPSDILLGAAVGTCSGILVPHLHRNNKPNRQAWMIMPYLNNSGAGYGLSLNYRLK